ncbi:hypothetical protein SAMN05428975_4192 [Mucilaginibacter sp. OK268]|nr:hypothetical protein SAMN05428975_4192 [Mucilaginibacter sp. OK268]
MCEHLIELERFIKANGIQETFRGKAWSDSCREWVYFDCLLDLTSLRNRFQFPAFILTHINDDNKSGMEAGFVCDLCKDAIMGLHPHFAKGKVIIT